MPTRPAFVLLRPFVQFTNKLKARVSIISALLVITSNLVVILFFVRHKQRDGALNLCVLILNFAYIYKSNGMLENSTRCCSPLFYYQCNKY